ncbi:hypothetical protein N9S25_00700 [bacterium]|jgi:hypothetical protein|nr:hypothetical protein [bacterium]
MKNEWRKLGRIFSSSKDAETIITHASLPIAENISEDIFKIYFSSRDEKQRSFCNYIVININNPQDILEISSQPVLSPGAIGAFDDSGAMASWLVTYDKKKLLYYIGWNLGVTVPFRNSIGLAEINIHGDFQRVSQGPIIERSNIDPFMSGSCCVIPGKDKWRMWYLSCTEWVVRESKPTHRYHIKYAESNDGIRWKRDGIVAIDYKDDNEIAISRPSVLFDAGIWKMWFSFRGDKYRIGYAESEDGIHWARQDHLSGIHLSKTGWDSEAIEYPFVFNYKGSKYMLYNGNEYGKTGFGLAIWN